MTTTESPAWPYRTTNGDLEFWRHVAELVIENDPRASSNRGKGSKRWQQIAESMETWCELW